MNSAAPNATYFEPYPLASGELETEPFSEIREASAYGST